MKKFRSMLMIVLALVMALSFAGCGKKGEDGSFNEDGTFKPSAKGTQLKFIGWGNQDEEEVFNALVNDFNNTIGKDNNIKVDYTRYAGQGEYETKAKLGLSSNNTPDVVYVGDGSIKPWVDLNYLQPLDQPIEIGGRTIEGGLISTNGGFDKSDEKIWPSAINRYRYDKQNATFNADDPLYALPKDIGPTVIYYNETFMKNANITIISVPESEIKDKIGQAIETDAEGNAVTGKTYTYRGYDGRQKVFNNRIAMSWEETVELANVLKPYTRETATKDHYGFFTEWWFSYGWSVGGDCMEYTTDAENKPYYKFTLGDEQKNYIVKDATGDTPITVTVGSKEYKSGEILSYNDRNTLLAMNETEKAAIMNKLNELPSQREAFTEFCRLSATTDTVVDDPTPDSPNSGDEIKGYDVAMNPDTLSGTEYITMFSGGYCAMMVQGRWQVTTLRKTIRNYTWNVAPLPVYRQYANEEGTEVAVHGISAGHSGSCGIGIAAKSKNKAAAWLLVQYIAGAAGQTAQAKKGFAIPNQRELAMRDDVFLQTDKLPKNSIVFVEAALYERPADWTYLKDGEWIKEWSDLLNGDVRDGKCTISSFFSQVTARTQNKLNTYNGYPNVQPLA